LSIHTARGHTCTALRSVQCRCVAVGFSVYSTSLRDNAMEKTSRYPKQVFLHILFSPHRTLIQISIIRCLWL
jgi:hypothetical protein